jgi:hypothetical protein
MASLQATSVNGTLTSLRQENTTATSKSLALADQDKVVVCTNTSAITITVPTEASVAFSVGSVVYIARTGSGDVTLAAAGGVTLTRSGLMGLNEELYVRKRASNSWIVIDRPFNLTASGGTASTSGNFSVNTFTSGTSAFTVAN